MKAIQRCEVHTKDLVSLQQFNCCSSCCPETSMASAKTFDLVKSLLQLLSEALGVDALDQNATRTALGAVYDELLTQTSISSSSRWIKDEAREDLIIELSAAVGVQLRYPCRTNPCCLCCSCLQL
jgi:hypothetical protein